jgi:hypothetical protein
MNDYIQIAAPVSAKAINWTLILMGFLVAAARVEFHSLARLQG